jgi:hypothetical protein
MQVGKKKENLYFVAPIMRKRGVNLKTREEKLAIHMTACEFFLHKLDKIYN